MALTDIKIRNAKPGDREFKLADAGGLYLLVTPAGGKLWRVKFRIGGKERKLSLGGWPAVSLAMARKERDKARELIAAGGDPAREKQLEKRRAIEGAAATFSVMAQEYCEKRKREGWAEATAEKSEFLLSQLADIGTMPIAEILPADVLACLKKIERRGKLETARRSLQFASNVFRYGVATARVVSDPTRDLRGALTTPKVRHHAAIIAPVRVGELLRAIDGYEGQGMTKLALQLAPHVFVRPGELRQARWDEIDLDASLWVIPPEKAKMRKAHHVPLSTQALALMREVRSVTGPAGYVFPSIRSRARPMSENTINAALRRLGYTSDEMTAHGFRAMASTLLNESGKWHPDAIERALAHGDNDKVRAAYHRGAHWNERVEMAQWWSNHLDTLRKGADVVPIKKAKGGGK